jgi:hypothetical protein
VNVETRSDSESRFAPDRYAVWPARKYPAQGPVVGTDEHVSAWWGKYLVQGHLTAKKSNEDLLALGGSKSKS